MKRILPLFLILSMSLSCEREEPAPPTLSLSTDTFEVPAEGGDIRIGVQSNVEVHVELPEGIGWITEIKDRAIPSGYFLFRIDANPDNDSRTAKIRFCSTEPSLTGTATVIQLQKDEMILSDESITVSEAGGTFEVKLETNVEYDIHINADWIKVVPPVRGLAYCSHTFIAEPLPAENFEREASISFYKNNFSKTVTIRQIDQSPLIVFKDPAVKGLCVGKWDLNHDSELSEREASLVADLGTFSNTEIKNFDELAYFKGLVSIPRYAFQDCRLLTSIRFPDNLVAIEEMAFWGAGLTGELKLPGKLELIGRYAFYDCSNLTGPLVIPDEVTVIGEGAFAHCSGLSSLTLPENLTSIGEMAFSECNLLTRIDLLAAEPPACSQNTFYLTGNCLFYVPSGSAAIYQKTKDWLVYAGRITEEGCRPSDFFYCSTDYSRDGEVVCMQQATKGKGIDLIFMGDGFVDKDMVPGGKYETLMRQWMEQFFIYEPYRSFRDWFSVYMVKVVSKNDVYGTPDAQRRLTVDLESDDGVAGNAISVPETYREYAFRVPGVDKNSLKVVIFANTEASLGRSFCAKASNGFFLSLILDGINSRPTTINHEVGGHGIGWLGDEYSESLTAPSHARQELEQSWSWGAYTNLDWRSDPETVLWSHFLKDSRYSSEGLGVFEGGNRYKYGFYRPTMNSLMNDDSQPGVTFNAPSREAIYKNIMRWGIGEDWEYDYESFVVADDSGRKQAAAAYAAHSATRHISSVKCEPDLPPFFIDSTVKEIRVTEDGKVTLIR